MQGKIFIFMYLLDESKYVVVIVCDGMASPLASNATKPALVPETFSWLWNKGGQTSNRPSRSVSMQDDSLLARLGKKVLFSEYDDDKRLEKVVTRPTRLSATPGFWSLPIFVLILTE